jgi:hypothetical protein
MFSTLIIEDVHFVRQMFTSPTKGERRLETPVTVVEPVDC